MSSQRHFALLAASAAAVAAAGIATTGAPATAGSVRSTTTFSDDFTGPSVDTSRWTVGDTATNWSGVGSGQCQEAGNVWVSDGVLHLRSTVKAAAFTCTYPNGSTFQTRRSTAAVGTKGKFSQTYGSWQIRAKFPAEASYGASALWLYPVKEVYGAWPRSGEIDIAERMSVTNQYSYSSLHYLDSSGGTSYSASDGDGNPGETRACAADVTQWHVYGVKWDRRLMTYTVDGNVCATLDWAPSNVRAPAPFDQPFFTTLRQSAGTEQTSVDVQREMLVDWVKVSS